MNNWPALHKWTPKYLKKAFKGHQTLAGDYPMSFDNFLAYSRQSKDEMPLYLFDKHFAHKAPQLAADYQVACISNMHCVPLHSMMLAHVSKCS